MQGLGERINQKEPARRVFRKMPEANFLAQFLSIAPTLCDDETKAAVAGETLRRNRAAA